MTFSYSSTSVFQVSMFDFIWSTYSWTLGSTFWIKLKYGSIMKLKKPTWPFAKFVVFLSQRNVTSSPNAFSLSPWPKNSLVIFSLHCFASSNGLVGLPMSAACTNTLSKNPLFFPLNSLSSSGFSVYAFNSVYIP